MQSEVIEAGSFANVFPRHTNRTQRFRSLLSRKEVGRLVARLDIPHNPQRGFRKVHRFCAGLAVGQQKKATFEVDVGPAQVQNLAEPASGQEQQLDRGYCTRIFETRPDLFLTAAFALLWRLCIRIDDESPTLCGVECASQTSKLFRR
jgi:hypothetical protein